MSNLGYVYWEDPDEGISSGVYEIKEISPGCEEEGDGTYLISNGSSELEVYITETRQATDLEIFNN